MSCSLYLLGASGHVLKQGTPPHCEKWGLHRGLQRAEGKRFELESWPDHDLRQGFSRKEAVPDDPAALK